MIRESAELQPWLADEVGRGGDGRPLDPKDNGWPIVRQEGFPKRLQGSWFTPLFFMSLVVGGPVVYMNREGIADFASEYRFTEEQVVEKIIEALQNLGG